jgi:protein-disulfide isomerase
MSEIAANAAPRSRARRRLMLGATALVVLGGSQAGPLIQRLLPVRFDFAPVAALPGFRRLMEGQTSGGSFDPLLGVGAGRPEVPGVTVEAVRADLCNALFGGAPQPGRVPIAAFSDYLCPFCKILTARLDALDAASPGRLALHWHEWPLLGPASDAAARAALAAERQGAYVAFQQALMRARFVATEGFVMSMARRLDIDGAQMLADMQSPAVTQRIETSKALARLFRFSGTPSMVVGRTVVTGAITEARLAALIDAEAAAGPVPGCAAA